MSDKTWQDKILDVLADIIARVIVGFGAALFVMTAGTRTMGYGWHYHWKARLIAGVIVGVLYGIVGLRKGPGVI